MDRATITIPSHDVNVNKSGANTIIDYPLEAASKTMIGQTSGPVVPGVGGYLSETANVLLYGAPSYGWRNDKFVNLKTGEEYVEVEGKLKDAYPSVNALLDDIAAQNYNRKVKLFGVIGHGDGEVLPYTQFGSEPPAGFRGNPNGDGSLVQMQVNPTATPTVTVPTPTEAQTAPRVVTIDWGGKRTFFETPPAGSQQVAHIEVPAGTNGNFRVNKAEKPGSQTMASTYEIAVGGKVVQPRTQGTASTQIQYTVRDGKITAIEGKAVDPSNIMEVSFIGDQAESFFVENMA